MPEQDSDPGLLLRQIAEKVTGPLSAVERHRLTGGLPAGGAERAAMVENVAAFVRLMRSEENREALASALRDLNAAEFVWW